MNTTTIIKDDSSEAAKRGYGGSLNVYLTEDEAAKFLRVSSRTLQRQRLEGTGCAYCKAGRRVLYRASDIERWLEKNTFNSTSEADVSAAAKSKVTT